MAEKVYILKMIIDIPNYERKDLKIGMSVSMDETVGDKFAKRGFVVAADMVAPKNEKELAKENAQLKARVAQLEAENKTLSSKK